MQEFRPFKLKVSQVPNSDKLSEITIFEVTTVSNYSDSIDKQTTNADFSADILAHAKEIEKLIY